MLARDQITLATITEVDYVRRYYLIQASDLNPPITPTTNPPGGGWVTSEPSYTDGSSNSLYVTDLFVFSDGSFDYITVQKSSSYEAAKAAWNKAQAAQTTAASALTSANGRNSRITSTSNATGTTHPVTGLALVQGDTWDKWDSNTTRNVIATWVWSGSAWQPQQIKSEVIHSLDVNKLIVSGAARIQQAVIEKLVADIGYFETIVTDEILAQQISAAIADIVSVRVENLVVTDGAMINEAVIIKLAAEQIAAQVLRTGIDPETGLFAMMDSSGFRVIQTPDDPEGFTEDVVRLGPFGDQLIQLGTGSNKVTINSAGGVSATTIDATNLWLNGRQVDLSSIDSYARGLVAYQGMGGAHSRRLTGRNIVVSLDCQLPPGRVYRIGVTSIRIDRQNPGDVAGFELHTALDGETRPWDNWEGTRRLQVMEQAQSSAPMEWLLDMTGQTQTRELTAVLSLANASHGGRWVQAFTGVYPLIIWVEDIGSRWHQQGNPWYIASDPPPPPRQRHSRRFTSIGYSTMERGTSRLAPDGALLEQGCHSGGENWETFFVFNSFNIPGHAEIHRVTFHAHFDDWRWAGGGTGAWCVHGHGSEGIPIGGQYAQHLVDMGGWPRNAGRDYSLPHWWFDHIKNGGVRGFAFSTGNRDPGFWGRLSWNVNAHWIDIDYSL